MTCFGRQLGLFFAAAIGVSACCSSLVTTDRDRLNPPPDDDAGICGVLGTDCGGVCVDRAADPNHCGTCPNRCTARRYCSNFSCVCRPGYQNCAGSCRDLSTDPHNCGGCTVECAGVCQAGLCAPACAPPLVDCSRSCVSLDRDPLNCGGCGFTCQADELCILGSCRGYGVPIGDPPCSSNPCETGQACCNYPLTDRTICVTGATCARN